MSAEFIAVLHRNDNAEHPEALVPASARIDRRAYIGFTAVLGNNVEVGAHTIIQDGVVVGSDTKIGPANRIYSGSCIGQRVQTHTGVHIEGSTIGDDVTLLNLTIVERGAVVGDGCELGPGADIHRGANVPPNTTVGTCGEFPSIR